MFKVVKQRRIEWPVLISVPQPGGSVREHQVTVEFEDIPQTEVDAIYSNGGLDADLLRRVVVGWKPGQFKDEVDNDIEFSAENLAALIDVAYVRAALITAWLQLHNGKAAARKN